MSELDTERNGREGIRKVAATFGRRETQPDAGWEREFAGWLRGNQSAEMLSSLFSKYRADETGYGKFMRRVLMRALCRSTGDELQVSPGVVLVHPETFTFGDSVFVGAQTMIQGRFDGNCRIGSHVWIGPQSYFDARDLVLEDYVGWGPGAKVLGSTHTGDPVDAPIITTTLVIKPVRVGFGADIGMNASILPGVTVGAHAIVGAGSVVLHDVPDYAIVAGSPAKLLRFRKPQN